MNMTKEYTYRDSHKYLSKGAEYEVCYKQPWQRFLWLREQEIIHRILEKYFAGRDINLLDFACGTGRITSMLEKRVKTSTGVDVSDSMLAVAQRKLKRTRIIKADITVNNVLEGRKFNLIMAFRFFLNAEPPLRAVAIEALAPLLAEDGYLVFNNHHNFGSPWIQLSHIHQRQKNPQGRHNMMTIKQMKELVEGVGLKVIEIYPVGFFHPPRFPVWYRLNHVIENVASRFKFLTGLSESPIAVCRWR